MSNSHKRLKERLGPFAVPCIVSERWLEFQPNSSARLEVGEGIMVSVMTRGKNDGARKICELAITREDLLSALALIERPSH